MTYTTQKVAKVFVLLCLFALSCYFAQKVYPNDGETKENKENSLEAMKAQLKKELREEVKQEVLAEVRQEIGTLVAEEIRRETQEANNKNSGNQTVQLSANEREPIHDAIKRAVHETLQSHKLPKNTIPDDDLDRYYASGSVDAGADVGPGTKSAISSDILLARNEGGSSTLRTKDTPDSIGESAAKERPQTIERTLEQKGSILLPKGTLQVEPSLTYAHFSSNRINIQGFSILPVLVIGDIAVEKIKRDVFINTWSVKYGLLNNFQTELKVPIRSEYDRFSRTGGAETTRGTSGLGDVELGISRQIAWEHGAVPDLVAAVSVKSNTGRSYNHDIGLGSGHWAIRNSLIAAKSSDPAVIFGSLNYTYNFERNDIDNFGDIKPGDTYGYSLGTAIALSYQTSINFSFDHSITTKVERNGEQVDDTFQNAASFKTGLNWALNENQSVDLGVSVGLTTDAPDFTVEARYPITF